MHMDELRLSMKNNNKDIIEAISEANNFLDKLGISAVFIYKINLVLEEILTNINKYAYAQGVIGHVETYILHSNDFVSIRFVDHGSPFNPLEAPKPNFGDSLSEARVGGLGIYLVRNVSSSIEYCRKNESNVLNVTIALQN
jgi:anti-sigma regulatory factor (Ser/Thr protein kinase)